MYIKINKSLIYLTIISAIALSIFISINENISMNIKINMYHIIKYYYLKIEKFLKWLNNNFNYKLYLCFINHLSLYENLLEIKKRKYFSFFFLINYFRFYF